MIEITEILNELNRERPIFHSEADFQHALAWKIHERNPGIEIRLERRMDFPDRELTLDIFATPKDDKFFAMEVKYKPKKYKIKLPIKGLDEEYNLKGNQARDHDRYDFIKDISRLEKVLKTYHNGVGFAIFLTNDEVYWKIPIRSVNTADKEFRIHEGMTIQGRLSWKKGTSEGTKSGRSESIILKEKYMLNWNDYSDMKKQNGEFRYLLVEVGHDDYK